MDFVFFSPVVFLAKSESPVEQVIGRWSTFLMILKLGYLGYLAFKHPVMVVKDFATKEQ